MHPTEPLGMMLSVDNKSYWAEIEPILGSNLEVQSQRKIARSQPEKTLLRVGFALGLFLIHEIQQRAPRMQGIVLSCYKESLEPK
jgi:hypothetical protein